MSTWYIYYDQLSEGKCVGEGTCRTMSHLNRKRYDPTWVWNEAKKIDEWEETNPGDDNGTSVRAAMDVIRTQGLKLARSEYSLDKSLPEGISANRWTVNVDELLEFLDNAEYKERGAIPFHNSWGKDYPKKVWMPCETWQRLMGENGEFTMITDL